MGEVEVGMQGGAGAGGRARRVVEAMRGMGGTAEAGRGAGMTGTETGGAATTRASRRSPRRPRRRIPTMTRMTTRTTTTASRPRCRSPSALPGLETVRRTTTSRSHRAFRPLLSRSAPSAARSVRSAMPGGASVHCDGGPTRVRAAGKQHCVPPEPARPHSRSPRARPRRPVPAPACARRRSLGTARSPPRSTTSRRSCRACRARRRSASAR
ncbi:hypothetical protein C8R44DRAFT_771653 [Mycena epipterygia]|nr:hypothetical protein C8R44DRAFT_771653 [Mycena epipterygia]